MFILAFLFAIFFLWHGGPLDTIFDPAHEIMGERIGDHLPQGSGADAAIDYMKKGYEILKNHPYNQEKVAKGNYPPMLSGFGALEKKPPCLLLNNVTD